ncbi:MAG TPA: FGLLP motif-containing membrane protein [Candidatus Acidoferrales bacterium]|nr:FGLLP motif-containing membrane protein [Candidatus Acidoferrales bacterium]
MSCWKRHQRSLCFQFGFGALCAAVALAPTAALAAPELINNGGFDEPIVATGGFELFAVGQGIGGWRVVRAPGNVGVVSGDFTSNGFRFPAASGRQWLDLTGSSNTRTGVAQSVSTTPGTQYQLSFAVGNVYDPGGIFGVSSTVEAFADGRKLLDATNTQGKGSSQIVWQRFSTTVTATSLATTLTFINGDRADDTNNGLDAVSLVPMEDQRSAIAASLASPADALGSLGHDIAVLVVAAGATLFITFPAQLFNHTFQENYDEIVGFAQRRLPFLRRARAHPRLQSGGRRGALRVALVIGLGSLLAGFLDPSFGLSWKSVETYVGLALALLVTVSVPGVAAGSYRRFRGSSRAFALLALPAGLGIALVSVVVSRLTSFQPGYLYGVVAGVVFAQHLPAREEGRATAVSVISMLAVAVAAWALWDVVNPSAIGQTAIAPLVILDDFLASVVVGGLVGTVIGLLPLQFLPGGRIAAWHRGAWAAVFIAALFGLAGILLWPNRGGHPGTAPLVTVVALFVVFGGSSVASWWYFERRHRRAARAAGIHRSPP